MNRATADGLPLPCGLCRLVEPVGTVPDYWLVEWLERSAKPGGPERGGRSRKFVREEDLAGRRPGPILTVLKGGE
jgi:hypothetical protein